MIRPPFILSISDFLGNELYNRIPLPIQNFYDRHRILPRTPRRWESIPDGLLLAVSIGFSPPRGSRRAALRQKYHCLTCVSSPCRLQSDISKRPVAPPFQESSRTAYTAGALTRPQDNVSDICIFNFQGAGRISKKDPSTLILGTKSRFFPNYFIFS